MESTNETLPPPTVVQFENVHFGYRSPIPPFQYNKVLENLHLNVQHGQIYALLGPSGCGKTTSIQLILGLVRPKSGRITVFGTRPNTPDSAVPGPGSGYMPQDLTLMPSTTVQNNFYYFGRINGLSDSQIAERIAELMPLLELPDKFRRRRISELSGGQQRRTSLAIALMHRPPLLLLDEPTVGLDPILIDQVWKHLHSISKKYSTTIILTTHYIEEAHHAHVIGLMRNGRLLAEDSPSRLLQQYKVPTIEGLFLQLCQQEDKLEVGSGVTKTPFETRNIRFQTYNGSQSWKNYYFNIGRVRAIIPDVYLFLCSLFIITTLACFLPAIQAYMLHIGLGLPPLKIPIAIIADQTKLSNDRLLEYIKQDLPQSFQILSPGNVSEAVNLVKNDQVYVAFDVPRNFSRCMLRRALDGFQVDQSSVACTIVRAYPDHTDHLTLLQIWAMLSKAFESASQRFLQDHGLHPSMLSVPIQSEYFFGSPDVSTFQRTFAPGFYLCFQFIASLAIALFAFLEPKLSGHMCRSQSCGVKPAELIVGHFLVQIPLVIVQSTLLLAVGLLIFHIEVRGSLLLAWLIITMSGISGVSLSILIASFFNDKIFGLAAVMNLVGVSWLASGTFWPLENIQIELVQKFSQCLPLTLPAATVRDIMNRGRSLQHPDVMAGFIMAGIYIIVPLSMAFIFYRKK